MQIGNTCSTNIYSTKKNQNPTMTSSGAPTHDKSYSKYIEEFNNIPKKANNFFWGAQFIGTGLGALGGLVAMSKGKLLTSAKQATIIGAAAGWFVSFCIGLAQKAGVVEKQNKLTQDYIKSLEK